MTDTFLSPPQVGLMRQLGGKLRRAWQVPPAQCTGGEDWSLWQHACAGHGPSATRLVRQLTPQALRLALQLLRKPEDAQDAVQDSFLRLWNSQTQDTGDAKLATYFNTIVINRCKTQLLRNRELSTGPDELRDLADGQQWQADTGPVQLPAFTAQELQAGVASLPARQRMALAMWAYADAQVPDIAQALGLEVNAAHQLLFRAKNTLRTVLQGAQP
jgi:RNA polymerase sigma-70 factor (ECF subfamily)